MHSPECPFEKSIIIPTPAILAGASVSAFRTPGGIFLHVEHEGQTYRFGPARPNSANEAGLSQAIISAQMAKAAASYFEAAGCVDNGNGGYHDKDDISVYCQYRYEAASHEFWLRLSTMDRNTDVHSFLVSGICAGGRLELSSTIDGEPDNWTTHMRALVTHLISGTPEMPAVRVFLDGVEVFRTRAVKAHTLDEGDLINLGGAAQRVVQTVLHPEGTMKLISSRYADGSAPEETSLGSYNVRVSLIARTDSEGYADKLATLPATSPAQATVTWTAPEGVAGYRLSVGAAALTPPESSKKSRKRGRPLKARSLAVGDTLLLDPEQCTRNDVRAMVNVQLKKMEPNLVEGTIVGLEVPSHDWLRLVVDSPDHDHLVSVSIEGAADVRHIKAKKS